jgi:hypothetical protein
VSTKPRRHNRRRLTASAFPPLGPISFCEIFSLVKFPLRLKPELQIPSGWPAAPFPQVSGTASEAKNRSHPALERVKVSFA